MRLHLIVSILGTAALHTGVHAEVVFQQLPNSTPVVYLSSRLGEDGSDLDQYVWDNFTLASTRQISELHWRGGYIGSVSPITGLMVSFWPSIPAGSEPWLGAPPLVEYWIDGLAGQAPAGTVGGLPAYDYSFTLPVPFAATGGVKYWVQIEAWTTGSTHWGLVRGTGGNNAHFKFDEGLAMYFSVTGDTTFSLISPPLPCPADLNNDGIVNGADLSILLGVWGGSGGGSGGADLNGDGTVGGADLAVILGAWGPCT